MCEQHLNRRTLLSGAAGTAALVTGASLGLAPDALAVTQPNIFRPDQWGAADPRGNIRILSQRPNKIIVHHTATPNSTDFTRSHAFQLARAIQRSHFGRGFVDTGQQFTISRGGHIMVGRHGSLNAVQHRNRHVVGAHCTGQNEVAVGIENEGTYTNVQIRDEQYRRLVRLCAWICQQYGLRPRRIFGHRDFSATQCPGNRLYNRLPRLRDDVRALL